MKVDKQPYRLTRLSKPWPIHGWLGVALILIFWPLNWLLPGLRTHWAFFPLWLGYSLTVDALVFSRKGHSMLTRNFGAYVKLHLFSALAWWLFEIINWRTQNWFYNGRQFFTDIQYVVLASISFSTVMPAVFGTAELVSTANWLRRMRRGPLIVPSPATLLGFFVTGWLMLGLLLLWPLYFFPFMWMVLYFILEPLNVWRRNPSLASYSAVGDWRPMVALGIGGLICGFFWEMWNFYAYPKWLYQIPFFDFLHIFEMPLLGYGGYLPFALELFALYHLMTSIPRRTKHENFIQIAPDE